jgi:uncharacterized protein (DUF4415 family)
LEFEWKSDEAAIRFQPWTRGRVVPPQPKQSGKTRITIRIDDDIVDLFPKEADASGGKIGYQTLINEALRQHVEGKAAKLEDTLRRIVREETRAAS